MKPVNTGIIEDPRSIDDKMKDLVAGSLPFEMLCPKRDWTPWVSQKKDKTVGDPQSNTKFESMACATFSGGHVLEQHIIWKLVNGLVPPVTITWLKNSGFFSDPNNYYTFEISKRFSAIVNGTTVKGNYFQAVWDSFRHDGVYPASKLPSMPNTGVYTEDEYLNPATVTPLMRAEAIAFLAHFDIQYESVQGYDSTGGFSQVEEVNSQRMLYCSPLQVGIPIPCSHGIVMLSMQDKTYTALDTYMPFIRTNDAVQVPVAYAMRAYITVKPQPAQLSPDLFSRLLNILKSITNFVGGRGKIVSIGAKGKIISVTN